MSETLPDHPLVSICMPAYNYGHFIEQSVRSAWEQSYRPLELVVVDDGSTDGTWELLERLQSSSPIPMKIIKGARRGVAAALNLALTAATGKWISILHADDIARPQRVARQLEVAGPDDVLVHCEYKCIDQEGTPTEYDSSVDLPPAKGNALRNLLLLRADVRSMTVMFRRDAFLRTGPYDESLPVEDWQSILRLSKLGRVAHCPESLILRRVHRTNISVTGHQKKTFSFKEIGIDVLREVAPPDLSFDRLCVIHSAVVLRNALALGAFEKVKDGFLQCWERFPTQRRLLATETLRGLPSWVWMQWVRRHMPTASIKALLRAKATALRARASWY